MIVNSHSDIKILNGVIIFIKEIIPISQEQNDYRIKRCG